jgi:RNA polymerase sigma-70 factor (ECF subfamily)
MAENTGIPKEADLVRQAREGDSRAFEELVRRHQRQLYAMLYRLSGNMEDAQELVQSSFIKAYTGLARFRGDSSFGTWIRHIAMNAWRNHVRDEAKRKHLDIDDMNIADPADSQGDLEETQLKDMLWLEAGNLPKRQKEALVLRAQMGHSFQEIASIMGCSAGAAKASYHHAVTKLREKLKGQTS